jgi:HK97 family phage major capsid protein
MDLKALREARAKALDEAQALQDAAEAEDRDLTKKEAAEADALLDDAEAKQAEIQATEAGDQRKARLAAGRAQLDQSRGRQTAPDTPEQPARVPIVTVKQAWEDDPGRGYKTPRAFMLDVIQAGMGRPMSERLTPLKVQATAGSDEAGGYSDPYGGFTIPTIFRPDVMQMGVEADPMLGRTTVIPMEVPVVPVAARVDKDHSTSVSGGLRVYRRAEADTVAASRMKFEQIKLEANPLMGISYATEELLTDSASSFAALIAAGFRDEFTSRIIGERLTGTGVGQFMGIMNSPCLISITKETGQAADTLVYENIIKMRARVWKYENAIWMANQDCLPQLMTMVMEIGAGGVPIYHTDAREDVADTLLGRPVVYSEYMKTVGDKGDIVCANWSQFIEGVYEGLQGVESIHVRFVYNERAFRFTMRNAGAPWWRTALTPKNGATLSPFVTLNARA